MENEVMFAVTENLHNAVCLILENVDRRFTSKTPKPKE